MDNLPDKMPKLGFGLMRLPKKGSEIDIPLLCDMVDAYLAAGLNYFDTAYIYDGGDSERAIGEALVKRHPRESYYLVDKLPCWFVKEPADRDKLFQDMLDRTGAGYFDLLLMHTLEEGPNYDCCERFDCFGWAQEKKKQGLIRHLGFSFHGSPELLEKILTDHPEVEFVQIQLNYADLHNPVVRSGELYEIVRRFNKPIVVMEPLRGGALANPIPAIRALLEREQPGKSPASLGLRYAASRPGVMTVLSGMSDLPQMLANTETFRSFEPLTENEAETLRRAEEIIRSTPVIGCTGCRYCCDGCPVNIRIPDIMRALNTMRLYPEDKFRPRIFYNDVITNSGRASECLGCGQCEAACPQHLPVMELMQEAAARLETEHLDDD